MSGLAGFVGLDGAPADAALLERMASALSGLGPDGINTWSAGPAALAFAQLATTPEAQTERQPLVDEARQLAVCLDGRLDNRAELLAWLQPREPIPADAPDSALLLALFRHAGEECVQRLAGDYAIACWDLRRSRLFCARSPVGWRTFHWSCDGRTFAFATDPRALLALPWVSRRVNEALIGEVLAMRFTSPTETLWSDVRRLGAGWALTVEGGAPQIRRWQSGPFPEVELASDEAYADRFRTLFDESLRACTRASGTVAAHLSGGLDSSSVVCRTLELQRRGALPGRLQPISAVFPGEPQDETRWIEAVETHTGVSTTRVTAAPYDWDWAEDWSRRTLHLPLRPNTMGTLVAVGERLRAQGTRILLTGEGGDDWFTGSHAHWPDLLRRGRWVQLARDARAPGRRWWRSTAAAFFHGLEPYVSAARRRDLVYPHLRLGPLPAWIRPEWAARIALADRVPPEQPLARLRGLAQKQRSHRYDFARAYVNWDNVLAFAASQQIELRHPFHDRRLTEFAMGLPGAQLLRNGVRKHLLREAMRGTLPELVRTRTDKARFDLPLIQALNDRLKAHPLAELVCVREGWLDARVLDQIMREHQAWRSDQGRTAPPESQLGAVWMAVSLDLWLRCARG